MLKDGFGMIVADGLDVDPAFYVSRTRIQVWGNEEILSKGYQRGDCLWRMCS
jgi:hypothetical protein